MKSLKGSKTAENLKTAFRNKTYDQQNYSNFASIATEQGYMQMSEHFRRMAKAVNEHARIIARFLLCSGYPSDEICSLTQMPIHAGDTLTNLRTASSNEGIISMDTYPQFSKTAYEEKFLEVAIMFGMIIRVDDNFGRMCANMASMMENGTLFSRKEMKKWYCNRCGYIYYGYTAPDICPLCSMRQNYFQVLEEDFEN